MAGDRNALTQRLPKAPPASLDLVEAGAGVFSEKEMIPLHHCAGQLRQTSLYQNVAQEVFQCSGSRPCFLVRWRSLMAGFALGDEAIPDWPAPATWSPHSESRGVSTMAAVTSPLPFIGVTPCRVADTRGNGFTGQYGPPALVANATRSFTIVGQCSIPASAAAVSFNFAALNIGAAGDLRVFPAGAGVPLVSTLNYNGNTPNIANAGDRAAGHRRGITVQADAVSLDLIIDVNGYYAPAGVGTGNTFLGLNAGNFTMTGDANTAFGSPPLRTPTGGGNTAMGYATLETNTWVTFNTATEPAR